MCVQRLRHHAAVQFGIARQYGIPWYGIVQCGIAAGVNLLVFM